MEELEDLLRWASIRRLQELDFADKATSPQETDYHSIKAAAFDEVATWLASKMDRDQAKTG